MAIFLRDKQNGYFLRNMLYKRFPMSLEREIDFFLGGMSRKWGIKNEFCDKIPLGNSVSRCQKRWFFFPFEIDVFMFFIQNGKII